MITSNLWTSLSLKNSKLTLTKTMIMKAKFNEKKRKILRTIYGALSFSTALFVFQACYGTPKDFGLDVRFFGVVKSKSTNMPIPGIKVSLLVQPQYEITDTAGKFMIDVSKAPEYTFIFEDIDSTKNGTFMTKDTVIKTVGILNISLDDK
jgi:hypothetical protein